MSGPYPVSVVVISGQENAGEFVIAASTFLSMPWQSVTPVSKNKNIRKEFLLALQVFEFREGLNYYHPPEYYVENLIEPNESITKNPVFWLALDKQGESTAKDIFSKKGESPDIKVYQSICKLNLLEPTIAIMPKIKTAPEFWLPIYHKLFELSLRYHKVDPKTVALELEKALPLTPIEKEYCSWFRSLYNNLMPWQRIIKNIMSDWS
jgi:hypothetical protein